MQEIGIGGVSVKQGLVGVGGVGHTAGSDYGPVNGRAGKSIVNDAGQDAHWRRSNLPELEDGPVEGVGLQSLPAVAHVALVLVTCPNVEEAGMIVRLRYLPLSVHSYR